MFERLKIPRRAAGLMLDQTGPGWRRPWCMRAYLRCRILLRIRRFLRPILRRPLPDFLVPIFRVIRIERRSPVLAGERNSVQLDPITRCPVRQSGERLVPPAVGRIVSAAIMV